MVLTGETREMREKGTPAKCRNPNKKRLLKGRRFACNCREMGGSAGAARGGAKKFVYSANVYCNVERVCANVRLPRRWAWFASIGICSAEKGKEARLVTSYSLS